MAVGITLVYAPHDGTLENGRPWTKAENVIYGMFSKAGWGVALAWVVYACHYGFGGMFSVRRVSELRVVIHEFHRVVSF